MKNKKMYLYYVLGFLLLFTLLVGCASESDDEPGRADPSQSVTEGEVEPNRAENGAGTSNAENGTGSRIEFSQSDGINEDGFWEGIVALDYVEIFDYENMEIPSDVHSISDEEVELELERLLFQFPPRVMDRAVVDGDTVNIDFVGSVDGYEFRGGTAQGEMVTIGMTPFIDDFLDQLIGHMPGETVNVEVTFPDEYPEESLQGEDALFVTTINFIAGEGQSELTDEFVMVNLYDLYGWTNVEELKDGVRSILQKNAVGSFVETYILSEVNVSSIPEKLIRYQEQSMISNIERQARMSLEDYLQEVEMDMDELLEQSLEGNTEMAKRSLVLQAIAEHGEFSISRDDVADYFEEHFGSRDYSSFEEELGMPYIVQVLLNQLVLEHIIESAQLL